MTDHPSPAAHATPEGLPGYNERLFAGGIRRALHLGRFNWIRRVAAKGPHESIIELGCFDGRLLDYVRPERYLGFDAGWEGGVEAAQKRFAAEPGFRFVVSFDPADLAACGTGSCDLAVALETLEHIEPAQLDAYLAELARIVSGRLLVTVPNEKGPVFLFKWLVKTLLLRDGQGEGYKAAEVVNATLGRMSKVARDNHKGFDYAALVRQIGRHFDIVSVQGIPLGHPYLSFSVGIVARSRAPAPASPTA